MPPATPTRWAALSTAYIKKLAPLLAYINTTKAHGAHHASKDQPEQVMATNVGLTDRAIRIVLGFAVLSFVLIVDGNARWWGLVGLLPLATGLVGWCALYVPLGIDTCRPGRQTTGAAERLLT